MRAQHSVLFLHLSKEGTEKQAEACRQNFLQLPLLSLKDADALYQTSSSLTLARAAISPISCEDFSFESAGIRCSVAAVDMLNVANPKYRIRGPYSVSKC